MKPRDFLGLLDWALRATEEGLAGLFWVAFLIALPCGIVAFLVFMAFALWR